LPFAEMIIKGHSGLKIRKIADFVILA